MVSPFGVRNSSRLLMFYASLQFFTRLRPTCPEALQVAKKGVRREMCVVCPSRDVCDWCAMFAHLPYAPHVASSHFLSSLVCVLQFVLKQLRSQCKGHLKMSHILRSATEATAKDFALNFWSKASSRPCSQAKCNGVQPLQSNTLESAMTTDLHRPPQTSICAELHLQQNSMVVQETDHLPGKGHAHLPHTSTHFHTLPHIQMTGLIPLAASSVFSRQDSISLVKSLNIEVRHLVVRDLLRNREECSSHRTWVILSHCHTSHSVGSTLQKCWWPSPV